VPGPSGYEASDVVFSRPIDFLPGRSNVRPYQTGFVVGPTVYVKQ